MIHYTKSTLLTKDLKLEAIKKAKILKRDKPRLNAVNVEPSFRG